ncbi:MAG: hypothetical protein ACIAXF_13890 [Phycisphaerales bacterium JB063]
MTHDDLNQLGKDWLIASGYKPVLVEPCKSGMMTRGERPDLIGWASADDTAIFECKVSVDDFLRDEGKPWRKNPKQGVGNWRSLITPPGLLECHMSRVPANWSVYEAREDGLWQVLEGQRFNYVNRTHETALLLQYARRVDPSQTGKLPFKRKRVDPVVGICVEHVKSFPASDGSYLPVMLKELCADLRGKGHNLTPKKLRLKLVAAGWTVDTEEGGLWWSMPGVKDA